MTGTREPLFTLDEPLFTTEGPKEDVSAPTSVRAYVMMPPSVVGRFKEIVVAERRTTSVVMQRCVEDFLSKANNEPRPYIPYPLHDEKNVKMYYTLPSSLNESLRRRSKEEGRDVATLLLRALLDYCEGSPDDPVKLRFGGSQISGDSSSNGGMVG